MNWRANLAWPVAALCLAAAPLAAQPATDSLLDRAARAVSARPLRAAFEQTLTNPDIRETKRSRGEFTQHGAMRFALRFSDPPGDAIVADGSAIWVYLPSAARGQVLKVPLAQGAQLDLLTQLVASPRTSYQVTTLAPSELDGRPVTVVRLTPRVAGTPFTGATLWIDSESALVRQLEAIEPSGLIRRLHFRDIRPNIELPPGALTFTVPPDVRVIDAAGLLGGLRPPPR